MFFHYAWLSFVLLVASVSASLPPAPDHPVYYNSTGLSALPSGPTNARSGSGQGTVFRRGLADASDNSASVSSPSRTKFTTSDPSRPNGKPTSHLGTVKSNHFPTGSGTSSAATSKPTYASSTIKRTVLSTGFTYVKRAIPSSTSNLASTGDLPSSVYDTRLSTGYTFSKPSNLPSGSMSTSASITLPKPSAITHSGLSTGYTYSRPSKSPSGSGYSSLTITTSQPSTGLPSNSSFRSTSIATSTPLSISSTVSLSKTATALSSTSISAAPSTFRLQIFVTANDVDSPNIDGSYISVHPDAAGQDALLIVPEFSEASLFTLNADGSLQSGDELANMSAGGCYGEVLMQAERYTTPGFVQTVCQNRGGVLNCATADSVAFLTCDTAPARFVEVGLTGRPNDAACVEFILLVVWGR